MATFCSIVGLRLHDLEVNKESIKVWYIIIYGYFYNLVIIISYLVLWIILYRTYTRFKLESISLLTKKDIK